MAAGTNNIPPLEGATPIGKSDQHYYPNSNHGEEYHTKGSIGDAMNDDAPPLITTFEASGNTDTTSGYEYSLRINATLPLEYRNGEPTIDQCVSWPPSVSSRENFTWYGLRIQLPEDATTGSGGYYTDVASATKELGFVQQFNATPPAKLLEYNITTKESQPTIRINFNDNPFWETYKFDFVDQGSVVSDGAEYQEFTRTMNGAVSCYDVPEDTWPKGILTPVIPTLTISLQRFSNDGGGNSPPSPTPESSAVEHRGNLLNLGMATIVALCMAAFV